MKIPEDHISLILKVPLVAFTDLELWVEGEEEWFSRAVEMITDLQSTRGHRTK